MLAPVRTAHGHAAATQPLCKPGVVVRLQISRSLLSIAPHRCVKSARTSSQAASTTHISSSGSDGSESTLVGGGDGSGGSAGSGGAGGGGAGAGGMPPFRPPTAAAVLMALISYVVTLVGAATAWDAIQDAACPRLDTSNATVSVIIPAFNEERLIADTVRHARQDLHPQPCEVIVVDGGSTDGTVAAAQAAGAAIVRSPGRGRGVQMNAGAAVARGEVLLFLHADTLLPKDAVAQVREALAWPRTVLVGFRPLIVDGDRPMWFSTLNNLAKTWYGPVLVRPASFVRGLRMMFGDQGLCCRAADLRSVGGYRRDIPFMEDAELCIALHMAGPAAQGGLSTGGHRQGRGRVRMLMRDPAATSGRRIAAWGELRANLVFAYVSLLWLAGSPPEQLHRTYRRLYGDVR